MNKMFFVSTKLDKPKIAIVVLALALGVAAGRLFFAGGETRAAIAPAPKPAAISYKVGDNATRKDFLAQFGWQTEAEPEQIMELRVPGEFDEVYQSYQALQRSQGFDLEKYKNKRIKRYSYKVTNYPGGEGKTVYANILVYEGVVIGGDISSVALDGFMHGFLGEMPNPPA